LLTNNYFFDAAEMVMMESKPAANHKLVCMVLPPKLTHP
jgi:hypothetical protein